MLKLLYLAELVDINIKYITSNTSMMMSLSVGYPQILASGYPDSKFTIRFSPTNDLCNLQKFLPNKCFYKSSLQICIVHFINRENIEGLALFGYFL